MNNHPLPASTPKPIPTIPIIIGLVIILATVSVVIAMFTQKQPPAPETQTTSPPIPTTALTQEEHFEGELAADFPDFPVYPGAVIDSSLEIKSDAPSSFTATWETPGDDVLLVMHWYEDQLSNTPGWTIESPPDYENSGEIQLIAHNGTRRLYLTVETEAEPGIIEIHADFPQITN
jgi:hypothetical protein